MEKFMLKLIMTILPLISPTLKQELDDAITALEKKAKMTENKWDDVAVDLLKTLIGK